MKIIIVGGGIGGLAAYLALEKYLAEVSPSTTIKVYESHDDPTSTTTTMGGGLGLAPNGLRAMSALCDAAAKNITTTSFQFPTMTFRNAHGTLLGRYATGRKERYGFDQVYLARASVHDALVKEVPESAVEWGRKVIRVRETQDGVEVEFEDGNVEDADLVIGADGVKSTVRKAIFGDEFKAEYQ
jgi:2-polyprenyl-6-methoxyphenol hydroxylase-like FAD-dependent oxidoreductase